MKFENIKEGSTIIAPAYLHSYIRKTLLSFKDAIPAIRIITLDTFLSDGIHKEENCIYEYYKILHTIQDSLHYNKKSISSASYLNELLTFINEIKKYDIKAEDLPETNVFQKESKFIINTLYNISTKADFIKERFAFTLEHADFTKVYIYDPSASIYESKIYHSFKEKGASFITETKQLKEKHLYQALNQRQEVESAAQYIISKNIKAENVHISVLNNSYIPFIHQVFKRYEIPYYIVSEKEKADIVQRFIAFIKYYCNQDLDSLIALFTTHAFSHMYENEFIEYVRLHNKDIHDDFSIMDNLNITDDILSKDETKRLLTLEECAKEVKHNVLETLDSICMHENVQNFLLAVDDYICTSHPFSEKKDRSALLSIRNEIKKALPYLKEKKDLIFFSSILENISISVSTSEKGCVVSDFAYAIPSATQIVLGCTQSNYPAFSSKNGIFDENYYALLPYPTLQERYTYHTKQYENHLSSCETLICFTPASTIDGKSCETSLEIETFVKEKESRYPLSQTHSKNIRSYEISSETSKKLFVKEGNLIHGSISSFEKYMKCPYSYFLRYGLKVMEPQDYTFNQAKCGTLVHYVLECLIDEFSKDYVYATTSQVEDILTLKFDEIIEVYPNEKNYLLHLKKRLLASIMVNLEILKEHEEHSSLTPEKCEYRFDTLLPVNESVQINLHGIIDRIDMNNDFMRIIDYKSSAHSLKEDQVFSAQQLQLVTYMMIAYNEFKKRPLGGFYYSIALPPIHIQSGKLRKRPVSYDTYTEEDYYASFLKDNRLQGWVCGLNEYYVEPMDDNGTHIVGVRMSKANGVDATKVYQFEELNKKMLEIYQIIGKRILDGKIECECAKDACTYCPYASLCMNANKNYAKPELVEITNELYLKGGRKNDNME